MVFSKTTQSNYAMFFSSPSLVGRPLLVKPAGWGGPAGAQVKQRDESYSGPFAASPRLLPPWHTA